MSGLPTRRDMFLKAADEVNIAYWSLGNAADWLRSDWTPAGSSLTPAQAAARTAMFAAITEAKTAINRAKDAAHQAIGDNQ